MQTKVGSSDRFDRRRPAAAAAPPARRALAASPPRPPAVAATEARLELLSRQLILLGEAMRRRIAEAEQRGQAEAEDVRQELRQAREELQRRIDRAETAHRELRHELGRIAETLIDRLEEDERRQVEEMDSLRERLASVAEIAEARHAEASRRLLHEMERSEARTTERIVEAVAALEARVLAPPPAAIQSSPLVLESAPAAPALEPAAVRRPRAWPLMAASASALALALIAVGALTIWDGVQPSRQRSTPRLAPAEPPTPPGVALRPGAPAPTVPAPAPPAAPTKGGGANISPNPAGPALPAETAALMARAARGDTNAELSLAALYVQGGSGLARNPAEARRWASKAALAGNVGAMHGLGLDYLRGVNGPADPGAAARWFRMAAERGAVDSALALGQLYEAGRGVAPDPRQARRWYGLAARGGNKQAEARLAALQAGDLPVIPNRTPPPASAGAASEVVAANRPAGSNADVVELQQLLARLGYYLGPIDGVASPELDQALTDYRKGRRGTP